MVIDGLLGLYLSKFLIFLRNNLLPSGVLSYCSSFSKLVKFLSKFSHLTKLSFFFLSFFETSTSLSPYKLARRKSLFFFSIESLKAKVS